MTRRVDETLFVKNLWDILCRNPEGQAQFRSNNGNFGVLLTKHHFDYIVGQRINHNQFIYQGIIFNLYQEVPQLEAE